ncbi:amidohydrolase, partial [Rhizobium ruizarguesonis]
HGGNVGDLSADHIDRFRAVLDTGAAGGHLPEFVMGQLPAMAAFGLRIGLGCDGDASNDNSNLMHCLHSDYMLQCLVASGRA